MRIVDLRVRYRELFQPNPPKGFGLDLLRRSIAQKNSGARIWSGFHQSINDYSKQLVKAAKAIDTIDGRDEYWPLHPWNGTPLVIAIRAEQSKYDINTPIASI